jgi:hypothetical protein
MADDPTADAAPWGGDPELNKIQSPLASNATLQEMLRAFEAERIRLDALPSGEADQRWDALGDRMDALAEYLNGRSYFGGFDAWDFEATYLNDEQVRGLFESDREWLMQEWMRDDMDDMLEALGTAEADPHAYTRGELRNLMDVLKHVDDDRAEGAVARLQRILT